MGLAARLASSAVLVPALAAYILWAPAWAFAALLSLVIFLASMEWYQMAGHDLAWMPLAPVLAALPLGLHLAGECFYGAYFFLAAGTLAVAALFTGGLPEERLTRVLEAALPVLFIAAPLGYFVLLRESPAGVRGVFFLLVTMWLVDTAAYLAGSAFGRRPLAPVLSPKKTVEGLAGGIAAGAAGGAVLGRLWLGLAPGAGLALGVILCLLGQTGDVFESLWKRARHRKDSGGLIPGHGGLLDRLDSFLLATPALYYAFKLIGLS